MQRAKNEKLKKQYVDKMLLFLNNKYSRIFKDKKLTNEKLRKEVEKLLGNQNYKTFDYQSNLKKVEKSILSKVSKIGKIKYEPVQMSKINDLLNFDKDKYISEEAEKTNDNNSKSQNTNNNLNKTNKSKEKKTIKKEEAIKSPPTVNEKIESKNEIQENNNITDNNNINSQIRPQSAVLMNNKGINDFRINNNIISNNNFCIYNQNINEMNNLSEKMRKLKLKEQDEWAIKAKLDHDNYIKEQNEMKRAQYEKQMKQRELLENQIKEKKEREEKLYNDKRIRLNQQYNNYRKNIGENELNSNLNNVNKNFNSNKNNYMDNDNNLVQVQNQNIIQGEKSIPQNILYNNNIISNNENNINYIQRNNENINNIIQQQKMVEPQKIYIPININQFPPNSNQIYVPLPQNINYQNQISFQNPQNIQNIQFPPYNNQYMPQPQYPINQNMNNKNIDTPINNQNILDNIKEEQYPQTNININNNNINNDIESNANQIQNQIQNQSQNQNINAYPYQELTNRNQFSDYDFRKKSGGDINQYYNEIRMRKQQIRDQYKQIEQENYLNAQKKKEERKIEKEREIQLKRQMNEPIEEMSNLLLREKKLKQKNLIDQINFTREINNNDNNDLIKFEKQKKMEDFRKTLDEQVNQKKKMQQIKNMIDSQEKKQDIYDMNQQFLEDMKNIQNKYEDRQEIFMMNNIIGNNNNFNDFD